MQEHKMTTSECINNIQYGNKIEKNYKTMTNNEIIPILKYPHDSTYPPRVKNNYKQKIMTRKLNIHQEIENKLSIL